MDFVGTSMRFDGGVDMAEVATDLHFFMAGLEWASRGRGIRELSNYQIIKLSNY